MAIARETLECFGGAGYIEDTGLPQLLRDAQVYPIWEGTTNVLSLDTAACTGRHRAGAAERHVDRSLLAAGGQPQQAEPHAAGPGRAATRSWTRHASDRAALQAGARGLAITLARSMAAALLCRQAALGERAVPAAVLATFLAAAWTASTAMRPIHVDVLLD